MSMTEEQARKMIEEGSANGDYDKVAEGLAVIKHLQQGTHSNNAVNTAGTKSDFVAPIKRTATGKKAARSEPINLKKIRAFNMFEDDGVEHQKDKLKPEEKGAWGTTGKAREEATFVKVECGSCKKAYEVAPDLARPIDFNPDGSIHNPNVCDECIRRKGKR